MKHDILVSALVIALLQQSFQTAAPVINFDSCSCPTKTSPVAGMSTSPRCPSYSSLKKECTINLLSEDRCTLRCGIDPLNPEARIVLYTLQGGVGKEVIGGAVDCDDDTGVLTMVGNNASLTTTSSFTCMILKDCNMCVKPAVDSSNCPTDLVCQDRIVSHIEPAWKCVKWGCSEGALLVRDASFNKMPYFTDKLNCAFNNNLYNQSIKGETSGSQFLATYTATCTANKKLIECPVLPTINVKPENVTFPMDNTKIVYDLEDAFRGGSVRCSGGYALYSVSMTQPSANYTVHTNGGFLKCGPLGKWLSGSQQAPSDLKIFCVQDASVLLTTTLPPTTTQPPVGGVITYTHPGSGSCAGFTFEIRSGGGISFECNAGTLTLFCPNAVYIDGAETPYREVDRTATALTYKLYDYPTGDHTITPSTAPVFFCGPPYVPPEPHVTPAPSTCVSGSTEFTIAESGSTFFIETCIGDQQILGCNGGASLYVSGGTFVIANMDAGFTKVAYLGGGEWLASNCETKSAKVFTTLAIRCVAP